MKRKLLLIDQIIGRQREYLKNQIFFRHSSKKRYIAKPEGGLYPLSTIWERLGHAMLVLRGKAHAIQFKEDQKCNST